MRISDWSSDVCSSDLWDRDQQRRRCRHGWYSDSAQEQRARSEISRRLNMCRQIAVGIDGTFRKAGLARSIKDGRLFVGIALLLWRGNWRKAVIIGAGTTQFFERNRTAQIHRRQLSDYPIQFLSRVHAT